MHIYLLRSLVTERLIKFMLSVPNGCSQCLQDALTSLASWRDCSPPTLHEHGLLAGLADFLPYYCNTARYPLDLDLSTLELSSCLRRRKFPVALMLVGHFLLSRRPWYEKKLMWWSEKNNEIILVSLGEWVVRFISWCVIKRILRSLSWVYLEKILDTKAN